MGKKPDSVCVPPRRPQWTPATDTAPPRAVPATTPQQEELGSQAASVWRFIMDRQLEAPDEFAALQTHRVQLAVARRQLAFVERMAQVR